MTDVVKEGLSACLDGELSQAELDLLLKRVGREAELRDAVGRYALIGEALRAERPVIASRAFAANVMAALDNEPPLQVRKPPRIPAAAVRYLRPVAGLAVAAGVAAIAVFSIQQPTTGPGAPVQVADNGGTPSILPVDDGPSYTVPTTTSTTSFVPAARLTNYVVAHSEYSSPLGRRSVLTGVLADDDEDAATAAIDQAPTVAVSTDETGTTEGTGAVDSNSPDR